MKVKSVSKIMQDDQLVAVYVRADSEGDPVAFFNEFTDGLLGVVKGLCSDETYIVFHADMPDGRWFGREFGTPPDGFCNVWVSRDFSRCGELVEVPTTRTTPVVTTTSLSDQNESS